MRSSVCTDVLFRVACRCTWCRNNMWRMRLLSWPPPPLHLHTFVQPPHPYNQTPPPPLPGVSESYLWSLINDGSTQVRLANPFVDKVGTHQPYSWSRLIFRQNPLSLFTPCKISARFSKRFPNPRCTTAYELGVYGLLIANSEPV